MSQHARIEELSDSDSDPPEDDLDSFADSDIIRTTNSLTQSQKQPLPDRSEQVPLADPRKQSGGFNTTNAPPADYQSYHCLYPIYFDVNRSRAEGRRVGKSNAVPNPLAREIVDAVQNLGLKVVFEPGKIHPKDWSNPGRIKVGLKDGGARSRIKNKHHLYTLVSSHLKSHPTIETSPFRLRIQGMPLPKGPLPPPATPKGWKLNTVLPLHSPAVSGGGVSENILKDMMQEMQGSGSDNPMASLMGGLGGDQNGASSAAAGGAGQAAGKRKREGGKKK